jgi:phage gpG-like protein
VAKVSGFKGNFRELDKLIANIDQMAKPAFATALSKNVGMAALNEVDESFANSKDPWDKPWQPSRRAESTGGQTLRKSGRLQRSMTATSAMRPSANGFEIGANVEYAAIHQYGGTITPKSRKNLRFKVGKRWVSTKKVRIPQRMMVPEPELSPRWERAFEDAVAAYLEEAMK